MIQFEIVPIPLNHDDSLLKKGQAYWVNWEDQGVVKKILWICCPVCGKAAPASLHQYVNNADGTVTLNPSLKCPIEPCTGHYWIINSKFEGLQ